MISNAMSSGYYAKVGLKTSVAAGVNFEYSVGIMQSGIACKGFPGCNSYTVDLGAYNAGDRFEVYVDEAGTVRLMHNGAQLKSDTASSNAYYAAVIFFKKDKWIEGVQLTYITTGEAAGDQFGSAVSLSSDGSRVAVGATRSASVGTAAGRVQVFEYDATNLIFTQLGSDIDGESSNDLFGTSVSLSADGTRLAAGASSNDGAAGANTGHARVFDWDGSTWNQIGNDIDGEASQDLSGFALSLSANGARIAIGAYKNDDGGAEAGHVRVYEYGGASWNQLGNDLDGEVANDNYGVAVSLDSDGSRVAVGGFNNDGGGSNAGHVRVLDWNGTTWNQVGADIDGEAAEDKSGRSVSLSGDGSRVAVGAYQNDGVGTNAGHVRVFDWDGTTWNQVGADIDADQPN